MHNKRDGQASFHMHSNKVQCVMETKCGALGLQQIIVSRWKNVKNATRHQPRRCTSDSMNNCTKGSMLPSFPPQSFIFLAPTQSPPHSLPNPPVAEALQVAGLYTICEYISEHVNGLVDYVPTKPHSNSMCHSTKSVRCIIMPPVVVGPTRSNSRLAR